MNIVACLKFCHRTEVPLRLSEAGGALAEGVEPGLPAAQDLAPLLAARALGAQLPAAGVRLIALSVGPPAWDSLLRHALALGADQAVRVWGRGWGRVGKSAREDGSAATTGANAAAAAEAMADLAPALVLTGEKSGDTGRECFGAMLAHGLGAHFAHRATELAPDGEVWRVRVKLERGYTQEMELGRPAVITLAVQPLELPYASLPDWMASLSAEIPVVAPAAPTGASPHALLRPPVPRVKRYTLPDAGLDAEGRIRAMVSLPATGGGTLLPVEMGAREQARRAARFLAERGYP